MRARFLTVRETLQIWKGGRLERTLWSWFGIEDTTINSGFVYIEIQKYRNVYLCLSLCVCMYTYEYMVYICMYIVYVYIRICCMYVYYLWRKRQINTHIYFLALSAERA